MTERSAFPNDAADIVDFRQYFPGGVSDQAQQPKAKDGAQSRFSVISVDDVEIGDDPIWMVDGLLPASGFGVVFGLPKSGKSFLLSDALFHVAIGKSWAGRSVRQGAVVYITGEGVSGFKRRLVAMRRHHGVEGDGVPFGVITAAPDFGHQTDDAAELIEQIRGWLASVGNPPLAAIAVDTIARAMKGADENTAKDMTTFIDNCGRIGEAFGCLVLGVHHAGKDVTKGARGSNALDGAVDVMWSVEKGEDVSTAAIFRMKDGEEGASWQFRLAPYVLKEATETAAIVSTCVVEIVGEPAQAKQAKQPGSRPLSPKQERFFDIVKRAVSESGRSVSGEVNVPYDRPSVTREVLKKYATTMGWLDVDCKPDSARAQFSSCLNELAGRRRIGLAKDHVWLLDTR